MRDTRYHGLRRVRLRGRPAALVLPALMICLLSFGSADANTANLNHFFQDVRTFSARFHQVVLDENQRPVQESSGTLWIERPGKFRWDYGKPSNQQIVGDGKRLWIYDPDLKQASVRELSGAVGDTPAQLLAGQGGWQRHFTIKELGKDGALDWIQMLPRKKDSGFESLRLGFAGRSLHTLELIDGLGQTTRITLSEARENAKIDAAKFIFKPPAGVDVIGE